eukprot:15447849-Alexandrium_andersonii.AAC.1
MTDTTASGFTRFRAGACGPPWQGHRPMNPLGKRLRRALEATFGRVRGATLRVRKAAQNRSSKLLAAACHGI